MTVSAELTWAPAQAMEGVASQAQELSALILQAAALLGVQDNSRSAGALLRAIDGKVAHLTQEGPDVRMAAGPMLSRADLGDSQVQFALLFWLAAEPAPALQVQSS